MHDTPYNPYKEDVLQLGASLLHLITRTSPKPVVISEQLDQAVGREVERLSCSAPLKDLIRRMLAYNEEARPTMQEVCDAVQPLEGELPPNNQLALVTESTISFYNFQRDILASPPFSIRPLKLQW